MAAGYALVHRYPELIALFASPELIATVERGQLWTEGLLNIVPSSILSVQILTNNIVVSLFAYCAGFLFGLGTLYILGLNGLMLGRGIRLRRLSTGWPGGCSASSSRTAASSCRSCACPAPRVPQSARRSSARASGTRRVVPRSPALRSGSC